MGCWNKTCGVTNLPIIVGDKVYAFLLEENLHFDRCHSTAFWKPLLFPFKCEYDDYGGGIEVDEMFEPILQGLKKVIIPMPLGENKYHDIAVNADILDDTLFFEAVGKGRLFVKDYSSRQARIDYVMVREDVVEYLKEHWYEERYVGIGQGNYGSSNTYIKIRFKDMIADIPSFIEEVKNAKHAFTIGIQAKNNLIASYVEYSSESYRRCNIVRANEEIFDLVKADSIEEAIKILTNMILGFFVHRFIESVRKVWTPGAHEGSQAGYSDSYITLCDMTRHLFTVNNNEFTGEEE